MLLLALALAATPEPPLSFFSGNDLHQHCQETETQVWCLAYVLGVNDALASVAAVGVAKPIICLSPTMQARQLMDTVKRHLEDHPETRHEGASGLVALALKKAFPCP
jgi:hypothetical protein